MRRPYFTFAPPEISRSGTTRVSVLSSEAARIIPSDVTPRSTAGSRFVTATTFFPTSSASV